MNKSILKNFYLWSVLIIGIMLNVAYVWFGSLEGYGLANLMLMVYAVVIALIPTSIYFIFIYE